MRRAFTLTEMLLVIGILALLFSLLLPALGRTREAARATVCRSNMKQLHQALMLYSQDNNGRIPIGYREGTKRFNSMIYSGEDVQKFVLFGRLHEANLSFDGQIFYCPSERNEQFMYDTAENPWPPGEDPTAHTFSGYACRPVVELPDDVADWKGEADAPRLTQLGNHALLADLMNSPMRITTRHEDRVNVVYVDGSVAPFLLKDFPVLDRFMAMEPEPPDDDPDAAEIEEIQDAIWAGFDRR